MTEFEKFWSALGQPEQFKELAEKTWHAAQRALLRTIQTPPYVPKPGEKVKILGLCHPRSLGRVVEVTGVEEHVIKTTWFDTKHEDGTFSGGILSEVELCPSLSARTTT